MPSEVVALDAPVADIPVYVPRRRWTPQAIVVGLVALVAVALGAWVRAWLLAHGPINSDEAVVGLMADAILKGHFYAFYWGQPYGGAEPYVVAGMFAAFGHTPFVLTLTASLLSAVAAVLVFALGRRILRRSGPALVAAVIAWIWPWAVVQQSTLELGFRQVTLICGLGALLAAHRAAYGPGGPGAHRAGADQATSTGGWPVWAALGLLAGVGWWSSPEIVYFAVPVLALAAVGLVRLETGRERAERALVVAATFVIGALPWLADNVTTTFASLHSAGVGSTPHGSYLGRLHIFFSHMGPLMLGLRQPVSGAWTLRTPIAVAACLVVGAMAVAGAVVLWRRGPVGAWAIALFVVTFPFIYAALPPTSYWLDGRYGVFLPPMVALTIVGGGTIALRRPMFRWPAAALGAAAVILVGMSTLYGFDASHPPDGRPTSLSTNANAAAERVGRALVRHHLTDVIASYWNAYVLDFVNPRLTATPIGPLRAPGDDQVVMTSATVAWLFIGPTAADHAEANAVWGNETEPFTLSATTFEAGIAGQHVTYQVVPLGFMVAVVPTNRTGAQVTQLYLPHS